MLADPAQGQNLSHRAPHRPMIDHPPDDAVSGPVGGVSVTAVRVQHRGGVLGDGEESLETHGVQHCAHIP
jgi:hypothetical protein